MIGTEMAATALNSISQQQPKLFKNTTNIMLLNIYSAARALAKKERTHIEMEEFFSRFFFRGCLCSHHLMHHHNTHTHRRRHSPNTRQNSMADKVAFIAALHGPAQLYANILSFCFLCGFFFSFLLLLTKNHCVGLVE